MRLIDADDFKMQIAGAAIVNNYSVDKANKMCELIDCQTTAFDLESVIKQFEENEIDILKAIDDNAIRDCYIFNKTDVKELFEDYTKEQIKILKSAVGGKIGE